jgi:hypothetical protein
MYHTLPKPKPRSFESLREDIKDEMRRILIDVARKSETISYAKLASRLTVYPLPLNDTRLFIVLDEISKEEVAAGRGMLSVVVVRKSLAQPSAGFFQLAKSLGRDLSHLYDPETCRRFFAEELSRVHGENRPG